MCIYNTDDKDIDKTQCILCLFLPCKGSQQEISCKILIFSAGGFTRHSMLILYVKYSFKRKENELF